MATLTVVDASAEDGAAVSLVAADVAGDEFTWGDDTHLLVENNDASSMTVTLTAQSTSADVKNFGTMTRGNIVATVAAGETRLIPAPPAAFKDSQSPRRVQVTYSSVTSVTVAAVQTK